VTSTLTGLAKGKAYHFRIVSTWAGGAQSHGADVTFTTLKH
jgi:hypothetical protein